MRNHLGEFAILTVFPLAASLSLIAAIRRSPQSSLAKMYVGELVETARENMTAAGETGPLQPRHIRAAQRKAQRLGVVPGCAIYKRRLFWRTDCGA